MPNYNKLFDKKFKELLKSKLFNEDEIVTLKKMIANDISKLTVAEPVFPLSIVADICNVENKVIKQKIINSSIVSFKSHSGFDLIPLREVINLKSHQI